MAPSLDSIQTASGALAVAGSLVVMAALYLCPVWRSRLYPVKWILAVISVFNFFTAANYLYNPGDSDTLCVIQAAIMQFFEICGTLYAFIMALETFILIDAVRKHQRVKDQDTIVRQIIYHLSILAFGISTTIAMFASGSFGQSGKWCWITKDDYKLYLGYIPIWVSVFGVLILDVSVVGTMIESAKELRRMKNYKPRINSVTPSPLEEELNEDESAGSKTSKKSERTHPSYNISSSEAEMESDNIMEAKMRGVFLRMLFYPLFLLLLFVPGSVTRLGEITNSGDPTVLEFFSICQRFCDPAKGTLNAVMWVFSDADVRRELRTNINKLMPQTIIMMIINKTTALNRSAMVSDDMQLSTVQVVRTGRLFNPYGERIAGSSTTAYGHPETKAQMTTEENNSGSMERPSDEYRYEDH